MAQEMLRNDWSNSLLPLLCASTRVPLVFPTNQQCWKQCVRKTGETDGPHPPLVALPDGGFPGVVCMHQRGMNVTITCLLLTSLFKSSGAQSNGFVISLSWGSRYSRSTVTSDSDIVSTSELGLSRTLNAWSGAGGYISSYSNSGLVAFGAAWGVAAAGLLDVPLVGAACFLGGYLFLLLGFLRWYNADFFLDMVGNRGSSLQ